MKLKWKVLLTVVLGIVALDAGIYFATDAVVISGFLQQEHARADEGARSTREIVGMMLDDRLTRMVDWADWDDMAHFVEDENKAFVESNIEAGALAALQWDVVQVAHPAGGKDSLLVGLDPGRTQLVEPDPLLVEHLRNPATHLRSGDPRVGFVTVGDTVWITASRQVHRTDKTAPKVPGRLVTCTRVDDAWVARLRKFTSLAVSLHRLDEAPVDAIEAKARTILSADPDQVATVTVSDAQLASFCWLGDLYGKPGVLVRIDRERPMLAQGQSILRSTMLTIVSAGAVLLLLTLLGVSRVLRRLEALLAGVQALRAGAAQPVPVTVTDELGVLTTAFNEMSATIVDRERSLSTINERMQLVLDSMGDGLVTCSLDGTVVGAVSRCAELWFGPADGAKVWDYLFAADRAHALEFEVGWQQIQDGFLPLELLVDQLPRRFVRNNAHYEIECKPVEHDGTLTSLLLVVKDVTARLDGERAEREARELQAIVGHILRDTGDFERFLAEMQHLIERLVHSDDAELAKRSLHTLKGNAAVYGFGTFAQFCHRLEDDLAEGQALALHAAGLQEQWDAAVHRIRAFLPDHEAPQVVLTVEEHDRFVARLRDGEDAVQLADIAAAWRYSPLASVFKRLARQATRVAASLGKQVQVETRDQGIRFEPEVMAGFWEAFVHVVRNAVDHGIENGDQRVLRGKPAAGRLSISASVLGEEFVVAVTDDGDGVDWAAVRASAERRGLPHACHEDLVAALFADGLSTRASVSELSGRGVGLAAVKESCVALGGSVHVRSKQGVGTTFTFRLPKCVRSHALAVVGV